MVSSPIFLTTWRHEALGVSLQEAGKNSAKSTGLRLCGLGLGGLVHSVTASLRQTPSGSLLGPPLSGRASLGARWSIANPGP